MRFYQAFLFSIALFLFMVTIMPDERCNTANLIGSILSSLALFTALLTL